MRFRNDFVKNVDYKRGFGGRFGLDIDRQDKCAESWNYTGRVELHPSQTGKAVCCSCHLFPSSNVHFP